MKVFEKKTIGSLDRLDYAGALIDSLREVIEPGAFPFVHRMLTMTACAIEQERQFVQDQAKAALHQKRAAT